MTSTPVQSSSSSLRRIVVLTGLSGAGKSHALKSLEDMGYEAIDNIPLNMLGLVARQVRGQDVPRHIVLGVDARSRDFAPERLLAALKNWKRAGKHKVDLIFLECDDDVLQRRFTETRRKHPLALDRPIEDGISLERELLAPVREVADAVVDTTHFSVHDLKRYIRGHFAEEASELSLFVTSFSFREGVPRDADMVIDVRFLSNPHYVDELRPLNGKDAPVAEYVAKDKDFAPFFERFTQLLLPLLPRYKEEGKSYFTVAVGCTGGKHRSVFVAEKLAGFLSDQGYKMGVRHRDLK